VVVNQAEWHVLEKPGQQNVPGNVGLIVHKNAVLLLELTVMEAAAAAAAASSAGIFFQGMKKARPNFRIGCTSHLALKHTFNAWSLPCKRKV